MLTKALAVSALLAGFVLMILGAALFLNVLSLRELIVSTRLHPAISAVFEVRDELSHRRAQLVEAIVGLIGVGMMGIAAWWLQAHTHGVREAG
jgi:hypothetical protein